MMRVGPRRVRRDAWLVALTLLSLAASAGAAERPIDDVRISREGSSALAEIVFACPIQATSVLPAGTGARFRIGLRLDEACRTVLGDGARSQLYEPQGREMIDLGDIEFHSGVAETSMVILSFLRLTSLEVRQGRNRNTLNLVIDAAPRVARLPSPPVDRPPVPPRPVSPPAPAPQPAEATSPAPRPSPGASAPAVTVETPSGASEPPVELPRPTRTPLRLVERVSQPHERFVIELATAHTGAALPALDPDTASRGELVYTDRVTVGTREWQTLRLGFFDTEQAASEALSTFEVNYPLAVVAVADVAEQERAAANQAQPAVDVPPAATAIVTTGAAIPEEEAETLMDDARVALLAQDYRRGIELYTRVLEDPGYVRRGEARELLGVARERNGQLAHAKAEYAAFLAEFPDGPDAQRVSQRLNGLVSRSASRAARTARPDPLREAPRWQFAGGFSQYFFRDALQLNEDEGGRLAQNGLQSRADLVARRSGERFDLSGRLNTSYYYDMRSGERSIEGQGLVSNAYVEIDDRQLDLKTVIGRQSHYRGGVTGRFDGARASYQWKPGVTLNAAAGFPVDSPRYLSNTAHQFYSMSADLDELLGAWDFSVFGYWQRIDGVSDREAVGGEARYRDDRWNVVAVLDTDLSYGVLNSALVAANWRATERLTLNGRLNFRVAPFLTTRNALIGQPVETVEDLLAQLTEPQVRRLARDRTAQARSVSLGLALPVSERLHLNADLNYFETDASVSSGGILAMPATGPQYDVSARLIGSSLFKSGDTAIFGMRYLQTRSVTTSTASFDLRYPFSRRLRVQPRLALSVQERPSGLRQTIVAPSLRVLYLWGRRHRFEIEVGGEWADRELPALNPGLDVWSQRSIGDYFNIGYWMEF